MTDVLDGERDHYRATGLTERLKTALAVFGPEQQRLTAHVAMNISDRARLYREIRRVLKSGVRFATFDVVLIGGQPHANAGNELSVNSRRDPRGDRTGRLPRTGMARRYRGRQSLDRPTARVRAASVAKSRRGYGARLRSACRQPRTKSHGRPARHPDRSV